MKLSEGDKYKLKILRMYGQGYKNFSEEELKYINRLLEDPKQIPNDWEEDKCQSTIMADR